MNRTIDTDTLRNRLAAGTPPVLVEALPRRYYDDWHLPHARHLPHDEVRQRAAEVLPDRDASVVVYCANEACRNSHTAAATLEQMGYTDVTVYAGGKQAWEAAGLNVERSTTAA